MTSKWDKVLRQVDDYRWEVPQDYKDGMRVPGLIYADDLLISSIINDQALEQVANVAFLPGIVYASMAMPDIHWGYGFPVGGVAATKVDGGVISPGGVGFDINCGIRMLRTDLTEAEVRPRLDDLVDALFRNIPTGMGSRGRIRINPQQEMDQVLTRGAAWAVEQGLGDPEDLPVTEESGCITDAKPSAVSSRARQRGAPQIGTLGSGNHFLEVQVVDEIYEPQVAQSFGITAPGQITIMIHCGSRGLGHQVCSDYIKIVESAGQRYGIELPDRQLAAAPIESPEGQDYLAAMRCAANFAWANRQCIAHWTRESFQQVFQRDPKDLGMRQVYDVAHNIAKIETHQVEGKATRLCVHRKGATRAFPAHSPDLPEKYREVGQPVLIPGDMGRYSFLAVGSEGAMEGSFGSSCHGAGRLQSRGAAKRALKGRDIQGELREQGIVVKAHGGWASVAEEAPSAYKDVSQVVEVCHGANLVKKVARVRPMGVIKG